MNITYCICMKIIDTASSAAFTPPSHEIFVNNVDAASSASLEGITG